MEEYNAYIADARALANPTPPTSTRMGKGIGQGSSVPRPPSSPPPGGGYKGFGKASQKRRMIGEGRGEAILPATSKAKPRKGKGKPRPTSKGLEEERLANEEETNQSEAKKRRLIAQCKSGGKQLRPSGKDRPSGSSSSSSSQLQGKGKAAPDAPWRQNFNKVLFV